jgi:hypothetical protein
MNISSLEKMSIHISNGWIIGCAILTFGIITRTYLDSISNIHLMHMKHKLYLRNISKKTKNLI